VVAVVLETTGDISVLHSDQNNPDFDESLLTGVDRGEAQLETKG
jgi:hypothetical protein